MTNTNETSQTARILILTMTNDTFIGSDEEVVAKMRENSFTKYTDKKTFMESWAYRAEMFSKEPIDPRTTELFIASNIKAGILKEIETGDTN